ncbi:MAG TPA: AMP-binding protein, partial [bacterium]|nr:AMP-binding protein [bacterium]
RLAAISPDDVARLIYTSGTTGRAKGIMLSHYNVLSNVVSASSLLEIGPGERIASYMPEAHAYQSFLMLASLMNGAETWYSNKKTLLQDLSVMKPTYFPGVPVVYKRFAEGIRERVLHLTKGYIDVKEDYSKKPLKFFIRKKVIGPIVLKKIGLNKIKRAVSGSAKLDMDHAEALENIGFVVLEGYGASETSPVVSTERMDQRRKGSVGKTIPGVEVEILSMIPGADGKRRPLPMGEIGEITVRGPNVFKGYFRDPEKTADAIVDGAYRTGDMGHVDSDGFIFVHGRCGLQVKMNNGEFVDLDSIAMELLKYTELIQSAAVDAEMKDYAVAVVSLPWEPESLVKIGETIGVPFDGNAARFASNDKVIEAIKSEISENEAKFGDPRNPKTPRKFLIVPPMSPETGEITSTLKFKVRKILEKYREDIDRLRNSDRKFEVVDGH